MKPQQTARSLREQAARESWSPEALVDAIAERTGVSRLRAFRLAADLTLDEVARQITALRGSTVSKQQLSQWETGRAQPREHLRDVLCQFYGTRPDRLGFGSDYSASERSALAAQARAASTLTGRADAPDQIDAGTARDLDEVRARLSRFLQSELSETAVEYLEARVRNYDAAFITGASSEVMGDVAMDLRSADELLERTRTPATAARLLTVISYLSGMLGILMLHLGNQRKADEWFLYSQLSADQTETRDLRAWATARRALLPLYYGNAADAVRHADRALALAGKAPSAAAVRALTVRARAKAAHPGSRAAVLADLDKAAEMHEALPMEATTDGILGITRLQLNAYLGETYTDVGDTQRGMLHHSEVLDRFAGHAADGCLQPDGCLDYALAWFSQAKAHALDGDHDEAATVISTAVMTVPLKCRTTMVLKTASAAARAIPMGARTTTEFAKMRDVLAFHASTS
ncbi:helix-turn-helix domain-containing protein [Actinocorallia populi]|uniref:helix-turn-helix domain-containing protein n=1 Tax=Actinocorallia populi TaxID=2079200 RepID=UPI000D08F997|nr:helix-turn-helix transcriptional regulator [Actinocorallia populi]